MRRYLPRYILFCLIFITGSLCAIDPGSSSLLPDNFLSGPEFTFTNSEILARAKELPSNHLRTEVSISYQNFLLTQVLKSCEDCKVQWELDRYRHKIAKVIFPDDYYIVIGLDPSVVEVQTAPIPYEKMDEKMKLLDKHLFIPAQKVNLRPAKVEGGGHIHFGIKEVFNDDPKLFRDFIVDMYNHPELMSGLFGFDKTNGPSLKSLSTEANKKFQEIILEFDKNETSIEELATRLEKEVYKISKKANIENDLYKYQAVNVTRITEKNIPESQRTVELRFIRPQQNTAQFRLQVEFFKKRIEYLKSKRIKEGPLAVVSSDIQIKPAKKFKIFNRMITEQGGQVKDYLRLLPDGYMGLAFEFLEKKYPRNPEYIVTLLKQYAQDSAFDDPRKGDIVLKRLKRYTKITPELEDVMMILVLKSKGTSYNQELEGILRKFSGWKESSAARIYFDEKEKIFDPQNLEIDEELIESRKYQKPPTQKKYQTPKSNRCTRFLRRVLERFIR